MKNCARAGALATGCELKITRYEAAYDNMLTNEILCDVFVGELREHCGIELEQPRESFGSTDLGNVSLKCPAIQPMFDITGDRFVAAHTKAMAKATQTGFAADSMEQAACAMALTAARVIAEPALLKKIRGEVEAAGLRLLKKWCQSKQAPGGKCERGPARPHFRVEADKVRQDVIDTLGLLQNANFRPKSNIDLLKK